MQFEIWFPVFTLILGGVLVATQAWIETRWGRTERRESQREQFQYEKLTELLEVSSQWHAIIERHYWESVSEQERSDSWPVGHADEPIVSDDRADYNRLWTDLRVLSFLIHDQQLREEIDRLLDTAAQTIAAPNRDEGSKAYEAVTENYLEVARRIGKLLSADLSK